MRGPASAPRSRAGPAAALRATVHSRRVAALKLMLPLGALVVLSTLFLLPRPVDPTRAIPQFGVDVEALARDPRVGAARYAGMTDDGAALTITAVTLRTDPDRFARLSATELRVALEMPDGGGAVATSESGRIDRHSDRFTLRGDVRLDSTTGYVAHTEHLAGALDRTWLSATTPVSAVGPAGTLEAGGMVLTGDGPGEYLLVFTGGVELVYTPQD